MKMMKAIPPKAKVASDAINPLIAMSVTLIST